MTMYWAYVTLTNMCIWYTASGHSHRLQMRRFVSCQ